MEEIKNKLVKLVLVPFVSQDYKIGTLIKYVNRRENSLYAIEHLIEAKQPDHIKFLVSFGDKCVPDKYLDGSIGGNKPITVKPYLVCDDTKHIGDLVYCPEENEVLFWLEKHEMFKDKYNYMQKVLVTEKNIACPDVYILESWLETLNDIHNSGGYCLVELGERSRRGLFTGWNKPVPQILTTDVKLINNKVIIKKKI